MTKKETLIEFKSVWEPLIETYPWLGTSKIMIEAWYQYTKYLHKQKKITNKQYEKWQIYLY